MVCMNVLRDFPSCYQLLPLHAFAVQTVRSYFSNMIPNVLVLWPLEQKSDVLLALESEMYEHVSGYNGDYTGMKYHCSQ